jgi:hypothetical protein
MSPAALPRVLQLQQWNFSMSEKWFWKVAFKTAKKYRFCQQSIKEFWSSVAPSMSKPDCRSYSTRLLFYTAQSNPPPHVGVAWRMVGFVLMLSHG